MITMTMAPEPDRVRILATTPTRDVFKSILPSAKSAHPRAAATLLEGLALWHQRPLCVLFADALGDGGRVDSVGVQRSTDTQGRWLDAQRTCESIGGARSGKTSFRNNARKLVPRMNRMLRGRLRKLAERTTDELRGGNQTGFAPHGAAAPGEQWCPERQPVRPADRPLRPAD
jgi:hypothetical protein